MEKVLCYRDDDVDDDGVSGITFNEKLFDLYFNLKWAHSNTKQTHTQSCPKLFSRTILRSVSILFIVSYTYGLENFPYYYIRPVFCVGPLEISPGSG